MDNPSPSVGKTTVEFEGPYANVFGLSYQLSADEQEILLLKRHQQGKVTSINLVSNWFSEIRSRGRATGN